jgi:hypothetical protein
VADGRLTTGPPPPARRRALADAVLDTLVYADLFDWPLTAGEIHRLLPIAATAREVHLVLTDDAIIPGVVRAGASYALAGRRALFERRARCAATSARLWPHARRLGRCVARLPWVRLVAVTGSLAVDAADDRADVDLFIVTADDRLWLTRALTIAVGRTAPAGVKSCPNYLVTTTALSLPERDRYTAHELAQLVPLHGAATYRELLACNAWYREHLPNHEPTAPVAAAPGARMQRAAERILANGAVDRVERWERERKVARLRGTPAADRGEVRFDATVCKGHFDGHRDRVLRAHAGRLVPFDEVAT